MWVIAMALLLATSISAQITLSPGNHDEKEKEPVTIINKLINIYKPKSPNFARLIEMYALADQKCESDAANKLNHDLQLSLQGANATRRDEIMEQFGMGCAIEKLLVRKTEGPLPNVEEKWRSVFVKDVHLCLLYEFRLANDQAFEFGKNLYQNGACGFANSVKTIFEIASRGKDSP